MMYKFVPRQGPRRVFLVSCSQFATAPPKPLSYYQKVLGLKPGYTADQLKSAYLEKVKKHHPDLSKELNASEKFQEIQNAYDILQDATKKGKQQESQKLFNQKKQTSEPSKEGDRGAAGQFYQQFNQSFSRKEHIDEPLQFSYNLYKKHYEQVQTKKKEYVKHPGQYQEQWAHKDEKEGPIWRTVGVGAAILGLISGAVYFVNLK